MGIVMDTTITTTEFGSQNEVSGFLLHLSDSAFPTGGYAHSYGLEEVVRQGMVTDEATLGHFLSERIRPTLRQMELPLVRLAWQAARDEDWPQLWDIDARAGALRLTRESRDASRRIGCRRLAILGTVAPGPALNQMAEAVAAGQAEGHHAVVFGIACSPLPLQHALCAYYYQTMGGYATAALKLIRIGQEGVHRVLAGTLKALPETVEQSLAVDSESIGWFDPLLDMASMHHEIAGERLFIS